MATKEQQKALGREVAAVFTRNPANQFLGFAGVGRHGGALILQENDAQGQMRRKAVVKYSLGELTGDEESDADADLRNEFRWLQILRGAEHIVRLVPFADCKLTIPGMSNGQATYPEARWQWNEIEEHVNALLEGRSPVTQRARQCPTFALEFLPNGQLSDTVRKLQFEWINIPNRILWRIWLCMIRQCVAMAYPPNIAMGEEDDEASIREEIIPNQKMCRLCQNSAHLENWVWGPERDGSTPDADHDPYLPVVKLIDFGRGALEDPNEWVRHRLADPEECGYRNNIFNAAIMMMQMAFPLAPEEDFELEDPPHWCKYNVGGEEMVILSAAPKMLRESRRIDLAMRDILVRCLAYRGGEAPSLEEVLRNAIEHVTQPPNETISEESDETIRKWTQYFLYDAFTFE